MDDVDAIPARERCLGLVVNLDGDVVDPLTDLRGAAGVGGQASLLGLKLATAAGEELQTLLGAP